MRTVPLAIVLLLVATACMATEDPGATGAIHVALAAQYFAEARALCARDGGRLWGRSLDGAVLLVDRDSRAIVANQADARGALVRNGVVFVGRLGESENIANTAIEWSGTRWTMLVWPLPADLRERARLIFHESFHRLQPELRLPTSDPPSSHLDTLEGRLWLQLEWRALAQALRSDREARREAVHDSLAFRAFRRSLFSAAATVESPMELLEGLAEYTGIRLSASSTAQARADAIAELERAPKTASFVRSFAYASGPAYGLLLDDASEGWQRRLAPVSDLGSMLGEALSISATALPRDEVERRARRYGGQELRTAEVERETARQKRLAEYTKAFVTGPVLSLPCPDQISYSFSPGELVPLEGHGIVFPTIRLVCAWGTLEATQGVLLDIIGGRFIGARVVSPPNATARPLAAHGWKLELSPGWQLSPASRPGDLVVTVQQ
jgi:hypothetical protein